MLYSTAKYEYGGQMQCARLTEVNTSSSTLRAAARYASERIDAPCTHLPCYLHTMFTADWTDRQ